MMCLGWFNRTTCKTRPQVDLTPNTVGSPTTATCPDISWFWLTAAAIAAAAAMKK